MHYHAPLVFVFWDRFSICSSYYFGTHCLAQFSFEPVLMLLHQFLSTGITDVGHHTWWMLLDLCVFVFWGDTSNQVLGFSKLGRCSTTESWPEFPLPTQFLSFRSLNLLALSMLSSSFSLQAVGFTGLGHQDGQGESSWFIEREKQNAAVAKVYIKAKSSVWGTGRIKNFAGFAAVLCVRVLRWKRTELQSWVLSGVLHSLGS